MLDLHHPGLIALGQHIFKHVVHPPGHLLQAARLQRLQHAGRIGTAADFTAVNACKQLGGRDGKIRLAGHHPAGRQSRQRGEHLASSLGQGSASQHAVGHVGTYLLPHFGQLFGSKGAACQLIECPQHRGRVAAASCHTGTDRDTLLYLNIQVLRLPTQGLPKSQGGGGGQVFVSRGQKTQIGLYPQPLSFVGREGEGIMQGD